MGVGGWIWGFGLNVGIRGESEFAATEEVERAPAGGYSSRAPDDTAGGNSLPASLRSPSRVVRHTDAGGKTSPGNAPGGLYTLGRMCDHSAPAEVRVRAT